MHRSPPRRRREGYGSLNLRPQLTVAQILKLTSPSKSWIDDDQSDGIAEEAEGKEASSPPTSFLPPPLVAAPRAQRTSSASSLPPSTSPASTKPQVGSWISKGSSPHSSPSPAKKARPSRSRASGLAARDRKRSSEELVAPASAAADKGAKDAPTKRHRYTDPPTSKPRAARASGAREARAPRQEKARPSSRAKRKARADSGSEELGASDDESGEEGDGLLNDVAAVAAPEDKKAIKSILRRDKGLRDLYL